MRFLLLGCILALAGPVSGDEIKFDFADPASLTNFQSVVAGTGQPGVWTEVTDEVPSLFSSAKAPLMNQRFVLAQTSRDTTDEHFPIFVYDGAKFQDFKLAARFKIVSGVAEQMAGVVFRFQNASNFYVARASALGHNVRFYKMVNGVRSDPIGPELAVTTGAWHTLTVQGSGTQITVWFDDSPGLVLDDPTFSSGKIGLWTKSDAVSYFSDLDISYTPVVSAAQTLVDNITKKESRLLGLRIFVVDDQWRTRLIASKDPAEIGQTGSVDEKAAITNAIANGTVSLARGKGTVAVWLPFRDRNGDPMAAVWVRMKSFFGETQETVVTRATQIIHLMQDQITSSDELLK